MSKNILICGVGGQGTVLASKVLSQAALLNGQKVMSAETIGMAQRGGSVVSHVRIGDDVYSPLIPKGYADVIIAFEAAEAVRNIEYLKQNGTVIVNEKIIQPITASLTGTFFEQEKMLNYLESVSNCIRINTDKACKELNSTKIVNMLLLGSLCKTQTIKKEDLIEALKIFVKPQFYELNVKAIEWALTM